MFRSILVPIDPSRPFDAANDYACALANRFKARVIVNYIVDEALVAGAGEAAAALDEAMESVGADALDDFVRIHPELQVDKLLSYGSTATVIFQSVLSTGAELVVVGGYHGGRSSSFWGSTVIDIVQHDERPTFVVRAPANIPQQGETIVVPYDGSRWAQQTIPKICALAKELGARIDLVNVAKRRDADAALHLLEKGRMLVEGEGVEVETNCLEASRLRPFGKTILNHARLVDSPLIAMSRLGRGSEVTGRSRVLAWLLTHSDLPVWVVRR